MSKKKEFKIDSNQVIHLNPEMIKENKELPKETTGNVKFTPIPELFTKKQVRTLLQEQVKRCASAIDGDNLSQYTAKRKIWAVELIEIK